MACNVDEYTKLCGLTKDLHYLAVTCILLHNTKGMFTSPGWVYDLRGLEEYNPELFRTQNGENIQVIQLERLEKVVVHSLGCYPNFRNLVKCGIKGGFEFGAALYF